jgi:hypothetical protein
MNGEPGKGKRPRKTVVLDVRHLPADERRRAIEEKRAEMPDGTRLLIIGRDETT